MDSTCFGNQTNPNQSEEMNYPSNTITQHVETEGPFCKSNLQGCCGRTAGLIERRGHARSQSEDETAKTGERKPPTPRRKLRSVRSSNADAFTDLPDARRSGPSAWVWFTPRTVLHACYFSSARSPAPANPEHAPRCNHCAPSARHAAP